MNIFTAFNDEYVMPTKVMIKSLIKNNLDYLNIYVVHSSLRQESIESIKELEDERVCFHFQKIDDSFLNGVTIPDQFSKEAYYRLFAHRIFKNEIERILWLDGDMIINGPLHDFYYQDFDGKLFIAVEDSGLIGDVEIHTKLGMPLDSVYINSGVLLMNLKGMREKLNDDKILQYITENQDDLSYVDQDVFNGLLHEHFLIVDPDHMYNYSHWNITKANKEYIYRNARVIHYYSPHKPWKKNYPAIGFDLWWKYALLTDPKNKKLYREVYISHAVIKMKKSLKRSMPGVYSRMKHMKQSIKQHAGKDESRV